MQKNWININEKFVGRVILRLSIPVWSDCLKTGKNRKVSQMVKNSTFIKEDKTGNLNRRLKGPKSLSLVEIVRYVNYMLKITMSPKKN